MSPSRLVQWAELPWLQLAWRHLGEQIEADRLPQAVIFNGKQGLGKQWLARRYAQRLLCQEPNSTGCGRCRSCVLFQAGTHPDFVFIEPAEAGKPIPVDVVRELIVTLSLKPQYARHRVVVIAAAEQLNLSSANSLLKTLEEPDPNTVFVLLTAAVNLLSATIRSRCQFLNIPSPVRSDAVAWLAGQGYADRAEILLSLAQGAPLKALLLAGDAVIEQRESFFVGWEGVLMKGESPVLLAEQWHKLSGEWLVSWLISWTMDIVKLQTVPDCGVVLNMDLRGQLHAVAQRLNLQALFAYLDLLFAAQRLLRTQANRQLMLEELLIHWSQLATIPR